MYGWIIENRAKAEAAGCNMDDQVLYVLTVADVAIMYDEMRDEEDIYPKPGKDSPEWAALPPELRASIADKARNCIEWSMDNGGWADAIREGIEDVLSSRPEANHA